MKPTLRNLYNFVTEIKEGKWTYKLAPLRVEGHVLTIGEAWNACYLGNPLPS